MKTNLEKWNYYKDIINQKTNKFIKETGITVPKTIYEVYPAEGMNECTVTGAYYNLRNHDISLFFYGKIPTRKEVEEIALNSQKDIDFEINNICFDYEKIWGGERKYKSTSAISIKKLSEHKNWFADKVEAEKYLKEIIEKNEKENYLLANGHIRCTYCHKVVPKAESVEYTVIARQYDNMRKTARYCNKTCGVHDQMAHEG